MKYKESDITKFSILLTTICNIFICITKIKYIEFIYIFIFLGLHIYIGNKKLLNKKEKVKSNKILFLGTNILIFFYSVIYALKTSPISYPFSFATLK